MNNIEEKFQSELSKIIVFDSIEKSAKISNVLLFKEYIRRLILWRKELNELSEHPPKTKDGHNLFLIAAPDLIKSFKNIVDFRINDLDNTYFGRNKYRDFDYFFIYLIIYWKIFKGKINKTDLLPDPFKPVEIILKRKGSISRAEGHFNISGIELSNHSKYYSYKLPSLDEDFLDYIDTCCGSHPSNIPNQKELDLIWKEYNTGEKLYNKRHPELDV